MGGEDFGGVALDAANRVRFAIEIGEQHAFAPRRVAEQGAKRVALQSRNFLWNTEKGARPLSIQRFFS